MKKGFSDYLKEREEQDFDMNLILEAKSLTQLAAEYGVSTQAIHKSVRKAVDKIFNALHSQNPDMSPGQIFIAMCMTLKPEDPRELFKNLGLKAKKAVEDEARELGIKV